MPIPPQAVQRAAQLGLELRRAYGRGGTAVGVARARDLSNGRNVSERTLARMRSYFARHAVDARARGWGDPEAPSAGWIAWLLWGGDAGRAWAERALNPGSPREVTLPELLDAVHAALTPDLLTPTWRAEALRPRARPYTGHCYVAAEAVYHLLGGAEAGLRPQNVSAAHGGPHWFLLTSEGEIIDPTAEQYTPRELRRAYAHAIGKGFLTVRPSKRARIVMDRVMDCLDHRS